MTIVLCVRGTPLVCVVRTVYTDRSAPLDTFGSIYVATHVGWVGPDAQCDMQPWIYYIVDNQRVPMLEI